MISSIQTDEARHSQQSWDEKIDRKDSSWKIVDA